MRQGTLANAGFEKYGRPTRRAAFLAEMEAIVPWDALYREIEPHYPRAGGGRRPVGLDRMLRIYFLQHWYNLSDPGAEEALYDSPTLRGFAGIDLGREPVPDETTICKFRHLLERHDIGGRLLARVNEHLAKQGIRVSRGTIVDATTIAAPTSTKNAARARDPDMGSVAKGRQWYFGMKAHVGVDSRTKVIHTVCVSSASVHDAVMLPRLLHGNETRVWGDQAYRGQTAVIRRCAPAASDFTNRSYRYRDRVDQAEKSRNQNKSRVRAKVEHSIGVIKRVFGFTKTRYRGLAKNAHRLCVACALANLFITRRRLLAA